MFTDDQKTKKICLSFFGKSINANRKICQKRKKVFYSLMIGTEFKQQIMFLE